MGAGRRKSFRQQEWLRRSHIDLHEEKTPAPHSHFLKRWGISKCPEVQTPLCCRGGAEQQDTGMACASPHQGLLRVTHPLPSGSVSALRRRPAGLSASPRRRRLSASRWPGRGSRCPALCPASACWCPAEPSWRPCCSAKGRGSSGTGTRQWMPDGGVGTARSGFDRLAKMLYLYKGCMNI